MTYLQALTRVSLIVAPFAIALTVAVNVIAPPPGVIVAVFLAFFALCGVAAAELDPRHKRR